jgi:MFS family permease
MLTLFLGYPSYSLSVTLFGMLVFGGIGSFLSGRYQGGRTRVLLGLLAAVALTTLGYQIAIPFVVSHWIGLPLPVRGLIATLLIAPVGLTLGAFMPIGLRTVAEQTEHRREFVAWAWAVNGFLSVIGSMLSIILAMILGFHTLMMLAVLVYAAGIAMLSRIPTTQGVRAGSASAE